MKKLILVLGIVSGSFTYFAQKNVFVNISPKVEGNPLQLNTTLTDISGKAFNITAFDYYLSNVTLVHDGGQIMVLAPEVYLIEPVKLRNLPFILLINIIIYNKIARADIPITICLLNPNFINKYVNNSSANCSKIYDDKLMKNLLKFFFK